jgi:serine/threonine protein kinase
MTDDAERLDESLATLLHQLAVSPDAPLGPLLVPGTRLSRFQLTEQIGRGGFGIVFEAVDTELGRKVAIKLLHNRRVADPREIERFKREAGIVAQLCHENVVTLYDYGTVDGTPYLVLERLHGETLAARLAREKIAAAEALRIAVAIARGVDHAHRAGIVHRDLKPSNVFLTTSGGVKVLDFGISKDVSARASTDETTLIGTPQYMAPEQALGDNQSIDARSDLFSLGAILYEMLSGRPAFAGRTFVEVALRVAREAPVPLGQLAPELPRAVVAVAERALAKAPAARFADAQSFLRELDRATASPLSGVLFHDDGCALALHRNVFINVWRRPATLTQMAEVRIAMQRLVESWPSGHAVLTVFDRAFSLQSYDTRASMIGVTIASDFARGQIAGAYVFEAGGALRVLGRAVIGATNLLTRPRHPVGMHSSLREAVDWLARQSSELDAAALLRAAEAARATIGSAQ